MSKRILLFTAIFSLFFAIPALADDADATATPEATATPTPASFSVTFDFGASDSDTYVPPVELWKNKYGKSISTSSSTAYLYSNSTYSSFSGWSSSHSFGCDSYVRPDAGQFTVTYTNNTFSGESNSNALIYAVDLSSVISSSTLTPTNNYVWNTYFY